MAIRPLGERGAGAAKLARCNAPAQNARTTAATLLAEADPDSWGAVSLKRALSMPGWKASVIAVEAGGHATQQRKHREAAGSGVRWRWCPYKRGRVEASSDITAIDVAPLRKRSNRKHGTAGSAKNTEVVPIDRSGDRVPPSVRDSGDDPQDDSEPHDRLCYPTPSAARRTR